jgi:methyl-accepting chemotaxis protein
MTEEDSFEKIKKGAKETGQGLEDTTESAIDIAEGVKDTTEGVIVGVKDTAEGVIEGVKDTAEVVEEGIEETADVFEDTAKEATDADTYTSSYEERKSGEFNGAGGKEPMNPEDIASHEPTAVKRDKKQGTSGDPV